MSPSRTTFRVFLACLLFHSVCAVARDYGDDIYQYGRDCAQEIGVELPPIDCLADNSTVLPVTRNGVTVTTRSEDCDKPALLSPEKACVAGAHLLKIRQTFTRPGGGEEHVTTMVLCRRSRYYPPIEVPGSEPGTTRLAEDNRFNDIGVIQYNETNHKTCWFYTLSSQGVEAGRDFTAQGAAQNATLMPPPYSASWGPESPEAQAARQFWYPPRMTTGEDARCIQCHNAGPWLTTPYVGQAAADYQSGRRVHGQIVDNRVPSNEQGVTPVHVGAYFNSWNTTLRPYRISIDRQAFEQLLSPQDRQAYQTAVRNHHAARLDACTSCHDLGSARQAGMRNQGICGFLMSFATGIAQQAMAADPNAIEQQHPEIFARAVRHSASAHHWMPPSSTGMSTEEWNNYYQYALTAVVNCCRNPTLHANVSGRRVPACYDPESEGEGAPAENTPQPAVSSRDGKRTH